MTKFRMMMDVFRVIRLRAPGCIPSLDVKFLNNVEKEGHDPPRLTRKHSDRFSKIWQRHTGVGDDAASVAAVHQNLCAKGAGRAGPEGGRSAP